jgi:hypothetical protein
VWTPAGEPHPLVFQRIKGGFMEACWPALRSFVEMACSRSSGRFTPAWVAQRLGDRTDALWALMDGVTGEPRGVVTTTIADYPSGLRVLEVVIAAGPGMGRRGARACFAALRAYQQAQGCARVEWHGRPGIARFLGLADAKLLSVSFEVA